MHLAGASALVCTDSAAGEVGDARTTGSGSNAVSPRRRNTGSCLLQPRYQTGDQWYVQQAFRALNQVSQEGQHCTLL